MFLSCRKNTEGVLKGVEVTSKCGVKRAADDDSYNTRKRVKCFNYFHNEDLEVKLKDLSGNICTLRGKKTVQVNVSKKVVDSPVPIYLWFFWLNVGIKNELSFIEWNYQNSQIWYFVKN